MLESLLVYFSIANQGRASARFILTPRATSCERESQLFCAGRGMLVSTMAQPTTPVCNVSSLAGMHSIQLLSQLSDPHRCPGAASRLPTDGTDGGLIIDGGTANDAEDAVQWLRARPAWRAIGFEPNRAECQRANAALVASARGKATMVCKLCRTQGRPKFGQSGRRRLHSRQRVPEASPGSG